MLFGLVTLSGEEREKPELCILPDKNTALSRACRLKHLVETSYAVHMLSGEEGFTVQHEEDGAIIVSPLSPVKLYITPNRPERPGFSVNAIKVKFSEKESDTPRVHFMRERKGWEAWNPNVKVY